MLTFSKRIPGSQGLAAVLLKRAPTVALTWDTRQKSRFDAVDSQGRAVGIFLPRGTAVRGGDTLVGSDGSLLKVEAAPQPVMVIRACSAHGSPFDLTRAAYHLGNRHVTIELQPDHLKIEPDSVLADMLRRMHLIVSEESAAFEPETGAYQGGHDHGHGHHHGHGHGHDHAHGRDHDEGHGPQHADGHGHGHSHDHAPHTHGEHSPSDHHAATAAEPAPAHTHVHGPHCRHGH